MTERILIVGYGSIGRRHLRLIREAQPESDIRVLSQSQVQEVPEYADGLYANMDEALKDKPTIAIIANPAPYHLSVAKSLMRIGCHLLIEKPMATNSNDAELFIHEIKSSGIAVQIGYNLRFLPSLVEFRRIIKNNELGRIFSIHCEVGQYLPTWRQGTDYRNGVSAKSELGGGVLLELSHELDYLRWIFGNIIWVSAWIGRLGDLDIDVEDTVYLTMGLTPDIQNKNQIVGTLSMDFARRDSIRYCQAIGTEGSLHWDALQGTVRHYCAKTDKWNVIFDQPPKPDISYINQWNHFIKCTKYGEYSEVSAQDGLSVLKVIEAARSSSAQSGIQVFVTT